MPSPPDEAEALPLDAPDRAGEGTSSQRKYLPLRFDHIHPSQRSRAGTIRAARVRWCDDGGLPEPMIKILIRNRPIQTLTHDQALGLANQIADLIQQEKETNGKSN